MDTDRQNIAQQIKTAIAQCLDWQRYQLHQIYKVSITNEWMDRLAEEVNG